MSKYYKYSVVFFLLLIFNHLIVVKNIYIRPCTWRGIRYFYDKKKNKIVQNYIQFLEKLDLVYFLGFGSELGAVRDGGFINKDSDFDVIVPTWKNYKIFKCNEYIHYMKNKCVIYADPHTKICNKTKFDYMIILRDYIYKKIGRKIKFQCIKLHKFGYSSCWIMRKNRHMLDVWISMGNEYVYNVGSRICKCSFSNFTTFCSDNAQDNVEKLYGKNWTIPRKDKDKCKVILYPIKSNSYIKKLTIL